MALVQRGIVCEVTEVPKPQDVGGRRKIKGGSESQRTNTIASIQIYHKTPNSLEMHRIPYCPSLPRLANMKTKNKNKIITVYVKK